MLVGAKRYEMASFHNTVLPTQPHSCDSPSTMLGLLTQGHWCSLKSSCVFTLDIALVSNYTLNEAFLDDSIWNFTLFSEIHSISFPFWSLFIFIWNIIGWIIDWLCTVLSVILYCIKIKVLSALAIYLAMYRMARGNKHTIRICWIVKRLFGEKV